MPLPPAPTQRASRLTHTAFETSSADEEKSPVMVQVETKVPAAPAQAHAATEPKRVPRGRKAPTAAATPPAAPVPAAAMPSFAPVSRPKRRTGPSKLFVLDTNVLMHDPMSLFRFEEHDVFLPMIVLEELDGHKKGMTEVARNARQASRSLDALASSQGSDLAKGSPLNVTGYTDALGQLFFQTQALDLSLPLALPQGKADNQILGVVEALRVFVGVGEELEKLAYEAGRKWGARVNTVSAGPYASRAASAIGIIGAMVKYCEKNSALPQALDAAEVGAAMAFLCSPLASGITGATVYVDKGYHSMGMAVDANVLIFERMREERQQLVKKFTGEGEAEAIRIREKSRFLGIWINADSSSFRSVPSSVTSLSPAFARRTMIVSPAIRVASNACTG